MIELRLLGTKCNIACQYCYQNPLRDSGNGNSSYDINLVLDLLEHANDQFVLWGGEPLLIPLPDLEKLLAFHAERYGENSILTNGSLITDDHLRLFKRYNVHTTISLDGPEELNDVRWAGTLSRTRAYTEKSNDNLRRLLTEGYPVSLNIQVTKCNSSPARIDKMHQWLRALDQLGLESARLHVLEVDYASQLRNHAFDNEGNIEAFTHFREMEKGFRKLRFDLFANMRALLLGDDQSTDCVWNSCDAYYTEAVSGIDGQGRKNNCGNTDKEGINFQKPEIPGYERQIALYHTPDEYGGCNGCRFFLQCKGQCPGTAKAGDWRNKSENCGLFKTLFADIEKELIAENEIPLSVCQNRNLLELNLLDAWSKGNNPTLTELLMTSYAS
jgi:uncharacterized protein